MNITFRQIASVFLLVAVASTASAGRNRNADLSVTLLAPASVNVSDAISLQAITYNHGPSRAKNATVTIAIPASVTVTGMASECYLSGSDIACDLGTLRKNRQHTISVQVQAPATGGNLLFVATAESRRNDPVSSNNAAQASVNVQAPPPPPPTGVAVTLNPPQQINFTACWTDVYDNLPANMNDCQSPPEPGSMTLNADYSINTGDPGVIGTWSQPTPETLEMHFTDSNYNDLSTWRGTGTSSSCYAGEIEFISAVAEAAWEGCKVP